MKLMENDLEFHFSGAIAAKKFDTEAEHGLSYCMKAVDFIVELQEVILFVEVKDPSNPYSKPKQIRQFKEKVIDGTLCNDLVQKCRDSFIYEWAAGNLSKPVHYLVLITLEEALLIHFQNELRRKLPQGKAKPGWKRSMVRSCHTMNLKSWNRRFPQFPISRISDTSNR